MSSVVYREIQVKGALNAVRGMPFGWSLNPFLGCAHACYYCFSRAYHVRYREKNVGTDFDSNVEVRVNIAEVLRKELQRHREGSLAIGTATDPYQPIEGKYRLTRRCLEALVDHPMPTSIVTKGPLVVRDSEESLDAAARAASEAGATAFRHRLLKVDPEIQQYYRDFLATEFAAVLPRYDALYQGGAHPAKDYEREIEERVRRVRARYSFR